MVEQPSKTTTGGMSHALLLCRDALKLLASLHLGRGRI